MKQSHFNLLRWMPIAASVVLAAVIAAVSVSALSELKQATYWREHTFQVILDAQTFKDKLVDAQASIHDYARKGTSDLVIEYKQDTNVDMQEFTELLALTRDNPEQQKRLQDLSQAVKAVFAFDNQVIGVYARQGAEAAVKSDEDQQGWDQTQRAIDDLEKFTDEERRLLEKRDATEQMDYHRVGQGLIIGSIFVAGLLVFSNFLASREMARRRRVEQEQQELIEKLQNALAEVKALSGLIPICGWCKNVRSDSGYWQTVEQYVRTHTDATFTHGVCPKCADKMKTDIAKLSGSRAVPPAQGPQAFNLVSTASSSRNRFGS